MLWPGKGCGVSSPRGADMRFSTILRVCWWLAVLALVIYSGVVAIAGYFRTSDSVDSAIDATTRWDKTQRTAGGDTPSYVAPLRDEIMANTRRHGLHLDPGKLRVSQAGRTVSIEVWWGQPVIAVWGETVFAVPIYLSRRFDIK